MTSYQAMSPLQKKERQHLNNFFKIVYCFRLTPLFNKAFKYINLASSTISLKAQSIKHNEISILNDLLFALGM